MPVPREHPALLHTLDAWPGELARPPLRLLSPPRPPTAADDRVATGSPQARPEGWSRWWVAWVRPAPTRMG